MKKLSYDLLFETEEYCMPWTSAKVSVSFNCTDMPWFT